MLWTMAPNGIHSSPMPVLREQEGRLHTLRCVGSYEIDEMLAAFEELVEWLASIDGGKQAIKKKYTIDRLQSRSPYTGLSIYVSFRHVDD